MQLVERRRSEWLALWGDGQRCGAGADASRVGAVLQWMVLSLSRRLLDVLRVASARVAPELKAAGAISGQSVCCAAPVAGVFRGEAVRVGLGNAKPFVDGDFSGEVVQGEFTSAPIALNLGGAVPAVLTARVDANGYAMHLSGTVVRARADGAGHGAAAGSGDGLKEALPEAVEGEGPIRVDLVSNRTWVGAQMWSEVPVKMVRGNKRR